MFIWISKLLKIFWRLIFRYHILLKVFDVSSLTTKKQQLSYVICLNRMKKLQVITGYCIVLLLVLTSVSAIKKLSTMDSLKQMNFGQSVPKHSLLLLYWFANIIEIDNNNLIRLTFDPNQGDYGSHHYGNYERMLEPLPHGNVRYRYYTVGNLNHEMSSELPSYVIHPRVGFEGRNRDRIIFRVREQNAGRQDRQIIDQVYITQHYEQADNQGTRYDPEHTYQVTTRLLNRIREFNDDEDYRDVMEDLRQLRDNFGSHADENQLKYIKNSWGELACLGLFLYIVVQEKLSSHQPSKRQKPPTREKKNSDFVVNIPARPPSSISGNFTRLNLADRRDYMAIKVKTSTCGTAMIHWSNIPGNYLNEGLMIALYKSDDDDKALFSKYIGNQKSGSCDTKIPLNEQLQARLHKTQTSCFFWKSLGEEIDRGDEFKSPEAVTISGNAAKLQLFVKNGKACARLYVLKHVDWKSICKKAWVGFYSSETKHTQDYEWWQWQWVTKFTPVMNFQDFNYDTFEYQSSLNIAPGVQARLMLDGYNEKARTPGWTL